MDVLTSINTRSSPQTQPADTRQAKNHAGGYTFTVDDETMVRRFLVLGTEGGTYYQGAADLTRDNAKIILAWAEQRTERLVNLAVEISTSGRAPKPNPAIFALAAAASLGDVDGRRYALAHLVDVCRTGTHLFTFATYVEQFRGWGPALRKAVAGWYLRDADKVGYQAVKYRQRGGWTHRDLLRLAHPAPNTRQQSIALFDWITHVGDVDGLPAIVRDFVDAQKAITATDAIRIIERGNGLSWEMIPTDLLNLPKVWEALIGQGLPMTALIRQLPRLTNLGLFRDRGVGAVRTRVLRDLADQDAIRRARIHPVNVLIAQRTYASGRSVQGSSTWMPDRKIVDALDGAFYKAFGNVQPAGKRTLIALDVSGSMTSPAGSLPISCREASAAMSLVTQATEPEADVVGFTGGSRFGSYFGGSHSSQPAHKAITELTISPRQRLDDVVRTISGLPFGATDCSLPMTWALEQNRAYDTFVIFTDNETWAGREHPHQALKRYREKTGINAKLIVCALTPTEFSIADPTDPGMLDIVGLDSAVPNLIADFSRGL